MKRGGFTVRLSMMHIILLLLFNLAIVGGAFYFLYPHSAALAPFKGISVEPPNVEIIDFKEANVVPEKPVLESPVDEDALNAFGKAVMRAGLKSCALPMNQLAQKVLVGHKVGAYRFPVKAEGFGSLSMEVATQSGGVAYMTFNLSEPANGGCIISYEAVSQWSDKCEIVVKNILSDFIPTRMLGERIAILAHKENESRKVFTMPIGGGCITTEKEIIVFAP